MEQVVYPIIMAAVRERTAESALPLAVGDLCAVTKAGAWRYDGEVVVVYSSGHYDVYLQDEKITLTNKPPEEVRRATHNSKEERYDLELAQAKAALGAPSHATARAVRINQSRTCCVMLLVLFLTFASVCAWSFLSAFSLMPQPGKHPSGMCELCVYARYGGRICNLWPEDSPRCHEHFLPWVYGGAFAGVLMCFPLLVLWMGGRPSNGPRTEPGAFATSTCPPLCSDGSHFSPVSTSLVLQHGAGRALIHLQRRRLPLL